MLKLSSNFCPNTSQNILDRIPTLTLHCLLGRFYFERISKSVLRLLSTSRTKIRISIAVQRQYSCTLAD